MRINHNLVSSRIRFQPYPVKDIRVADVPRKPREPDINPEYGRRLLQRITEVYGTQTAFAQVLGSRPSDVSGYCRGKYPEGGRLVRMAELLRCSLDWLTARPAAEGLNRRVGDLPPALQEVVARGVDLTPELQAALTHCLRILASGHPGLTPMFQGQALAISEMIENTAVLATPPTRPRRGSPPSPSSPTP